jgi:hypothetical protein
MRRNKMKLLEHAPESAYNDEDTVTYKQDREIIKIENVTRYPDGYMYAEVTFEQIEGDKVCMKHTYNAPYYMIAKFDTEFEGDYWEAGKGVDWSKVNPIIQPEELSLYKDNWDEDDYLSDWVGDMGDV